jgi:hypothetical protein
LFSLTFSRNGGRFCPISAGYFDMQRINMVWRDSAFIERRIVWRSVMNNQVKKVGSLLRDYHTEESLAREIGVTIRTLRRWRKERQGPPITHVGRKVVYSHEGLRRWLAANEREMPRAKRPRADATAERA